MAASGEYLLQKQKQQSGGEKGACDVKTWAWLLSVRLNVCGPIEELRSTFGGVLREKMIYFPPSPLQLQKEEASLLA